MNLTLTYHFITILKSKFVEKVLIKYDKIIYVRLLVA